MTFLLAFFVSYIAIGQDAAFAPDAPEKLVVYTYETAVDPSIYAYSSTNICVYDSVFIGVNNLPSNALSYNWQINGVAIIGANKIPYAAKAPGAYTLVINLADGSVFNTNAITVGVPAQSIAPVISALGTTAFCNGQSVVLSSSDPGNLQWQKDGINILSANLKTYAASVGGSYRIKYTPPAGCPGYSNEIAVTVTNVTGPTISESIHSVPVCLGTSFKITSSVTGVQWQKDGVNISGATNQSVDVIINGSYRAVQLNAGGSCPAFSNAIVVTSFLPMQPIPTITASGAISFCSGNSVVLTSSLSSVNATIMQWRKNGVDIVGATNQTYTVTQTGTYTAYVTSNSIYCNNTGTPSNAIAVTVVVSPTAPIITAAGNLTVCAGVGVVFTSNSNDVLQWQKDGLNITGAISPTYTAIQSGVYRAVNVGVSGCNGISNAYTITVVAQNATPVVTVSGSTNICTGSVAVLTSNIGNVQWQKDGLDVAGSIFQAYSAVQSGTYRAYTTGSLSCGANYSNSITIMVSGSASIPIISAATALSFCAGGNVALLSNTANTQWQLNGVNISGATTTTYSATQTGSYTAVVTNGTCTASSNVLVVTVGTLNIAPVISTLGVTTICNGNTVLFTSNLANVQWQKDGLDISGAVFQAYTAALPGVYRAYQPAALACGISYSNPITVVVNIAPTAALVTANGATSFCSGSSVTLAASIVPIQWRLNGSNIGMVTSSPLVVSTSGTYTAVTINGTCTTSSNAIVVSVSNIGIAPVIVAVTTTNICTGSVTTLSSNTSGVQWQFNGVDIAGAIFQAFNASQSGIYRVYVPGLYACGNIYSNAITVTVSIPPTAPTLTASGPLNFCSGGNVVLTSNISPILWQKDGVIISGTTLQSLTVTAAGTYTAYTISGACIAYSNPFVATVTANVVPVISTTGNSTSICGANGLILTSNVAPVQWQLNGVNIIGATNQTYIALAAGVYAALTTGTCSATSNSLVLTVAAAPTTPVVTASSTLSLCSGSTVVLSSSLTPVQWVKDNSDIGGATNQTLTISTAGLYKAYSTNGTCIAYSPTFVITVSSSPAPVISASSSGLALCNGNSTILVSSISPVQWLLNGANIVGATNSIYTVNTAGVYTAVGTSSGCASASNSLVISVVAATTPVITSTGSLSFCNGDTNTLVSNIQNVQWYKDGAVVTGTTNQTLNITQQGTYKASFTNSGGCTVFSNQLTVTLNFPAIVPTITASGGLNICSGTPLTLTSNIAGITWQKDYNTVATNTLTYTVTQSGSYRAVLFGGSCPAYSNLLIATVSPSPGTPIIAASGVTTFCDGNNVTLASNLSGVQWLKDGVAISGATGSTYTVTQAGKYKAFISNATCTNYSNEIPVTVNFASTIPTISANNSLVACDGTTVTFTSNIAGVTWQKDFNTVATNSQTYAATQTGSYRAVILGGACPAYSNALILVVNPGPGTPTIVPSGVTTFCTGGSVDLVSNFTNVQWLKDGVVIAGATSQVYNATQSGKYKASASNTNCTTYSNEIIVIAIVPTIVPTISASGSLNTCSDMLLTLSSNIAGVSWQKDSVIIASGIQSIPVTASGSYRAVVFGSGCPGYSSSLAVVVIPSPGTPVVTATGATTFCDGNSVILVSTLSGVQWLKDGVAIVGATGQIFTATQSGKYKAYASNGLCTNYSNEITVLVSLPVITPTITASGSLNMCDGTTVTLTSSVAGVTWQKDFTTVGVNVQSILASQTGSYRAVLFSSGCPGYSSPLIVTTILSPAAPIVIASGATTFCDSSFVNLNSSVGGVQWLLNGYTITNAFSQSYTAIQTGTYRAIVYGLNGCNGLSNAIPVTVIASVKPTIVNTSTSNNFCAGTAINLVSSVIGVMWQKDGIPYTLPGNIAQVLPVFESGTYRAVYAGGACTGYSNAIIVTALPQLFNPVAYRLTQNFCDTGDVIIASTLNTGNMQWQKDSINILGANSATYVAQQSGNYRMIISLPNACPSYTNNLPLAINTALKPVIVWDGNQFKTFTNYTSYQWYMNGLAILGANSNIYKPTVPGNYKVVVTSTITCLLSSDVYQLLVTAVTTPTIIGGATVKQYPNPASNEAWVEFSQIPTKPVTVRLLNANGSVVKMVVTRDRKINLPTSGYANGLYFIEVIVADEKIIYKLIIAK